MKVWGIADLHLSISVPSKNMGNLFSEWESYLDRLIHGWNDNVSEDDIVLIPGDICWATTLFQAEKDLVFIDEKLNGKKIISPGNHDFWWRGKNSLDSLKLKSITFIKRGVIKISDNIVLGAVKFTDSKDVLSDNLMDRYNHTAFEKEMRRLNSVIDIISPIKNSVKILMMHYPPANNATPTSEVTRLIESAGIDQCIFGHIHGKDAHLFNEIPSKNKTEYKLVSADYLKFIPLKLMEI